MIVWWRCWLHWPAQCCIGKDHIHIGVPSFDRTRTYRETLQSGWLLKEQNRTHPPALQIPRSNGLSSSCILYQHTRKSIIRKWITCVPVSGHCLLVKINPSSETTKPEPEAPAKPTGVPGNIFLLHRGKVQSRHDYSVYTWLCNESTHQFLFKVFVPQFITGVGIKQRHPNSICTTLSIFSLQSLLRVFLFIVAGILLQPGWWSYLLF